MSSFSAYYRNLPSASPVVRQHLPSIEWLVSTRDDDRRSGRTTALALAFLRDSFSSPFPTWVFDHSYSNGPNHEQLMRAKLQEFQPGLHVDFGGFMESEPAYAASPSSPQFNDTLMKVRQDFNDVVNSAVRLGVNPNWMMRQLQGALAESVMNT